MNNRTENANKNIRTGFLNKVIILLLTFVSRRLFVQFIGVEYLGINGLFSNILSLLSMADLGFGVAMAYSYYKPLAEKDEDKIAALIGFYKKIYNIIAITVAIIGVCLIPFLKYIINLDREIPNIHIYYIVALANTVASYLMVYKQTVISADQKSYIVNKLNIYVTIVKIAMQCVAIVTLNSFLVYTILEVVGTLTNNIIVTKTADKYYPYINKKVELGNKERTDIFANMKSVFLYKFASSIMGGTDSIIMSKIVGTLAVGFYSNYLTITNQLTSFIHILFSSLTAGIGNLIVENDKDKNYEVFKTVQMISHWISGIVALGVYLLIDDCITLWLGEQYVMGGTMTVAIAINLYFTIAMQPIWSYREAAGLYNKTKYIMVGTAIVNIVLSILMGTKYGASGIIVATVISRLVTYFWYEPSLIYSMYFKKNVSEYYLDYIKSIVMIIFGAIVLQAIGSRFPTTNWFIWCLKGVIIVLFESILFLLRYYKQPEFSIFMLKIRKLYSKVLRK